jgi:hypothetical protein
VRNLATQNDRTAGGGSGRFVTKSANSGRPTDRLQMTRAVHHCALTIRRQFLAMGTIAPVLPDVALFLAIRPAGAAAGDGLERTVMAIGDDDVTVAEMHGRRHAGYPPEQFCSVNGGGRFNKSTKGTTGD